MIITHCNIYEEYFRVVVGDAPKTVIVVRYPNMRQSVMESY